jgi:hypothetical protein
VYLLPTHLKKRSQISCTLLEGGYAGLSTTSLLLSFSKVLQLLQQPLEENSYLVLITKLLKVAL